MKYTKVLLATILTLILITGCAQMQQSTGGTSASPVLDRIQSRGELVVGTMGNMPPLNMTSKDGEIFGLEPDLARLLAKVMNVKVKFVTKPFNELLPALQTGQVDMVLSGMTITPERNRKVAFIGPYFVSGKAFLTKTKTIAYAEKPGDANNPETKIVVLKGSTSQAFAEALLDKTTLFTTATYDEAIEINKQNIGHAMIAHYSIDVVSVFRYPKVGLLSVVTQLTY